MSTKFEINWDRGKILERARKHEWDFRTITRKTRILMGQNVNENKAMTKVVIAIKSWVLFNSIIPISNNTSLLIVTSAMARYPPG